MIKNIDFSKFKNLVYIPCTIKWTCSRDCDCLIRLNKALMKFCVIN